ncbi:helix-turn-helix domain-containing protein [Levilactobacillus cerevisiae]|uniref:helix-turn-helix domain-containing protein n=1 Tax=Levilactobacillus cerevisiae TaxID=1704076 RepID=UPI000F77FD35|nr:helix-turn-helix transcriptional regulator [Levilactobacillus cerevisiae]
MAPNRYFLSFKISQIREHCFAESYSSFIRGLVSITGKEVGRGTLIRWERGQSTPKLTFLIAIAQLGSVSLDNILKPSYELNVNAAPSELLNQLSPKMISDISLKFGQIKNFPVERTVSKFSRDIFSEFGYNISTVKLTYWINGEHLPNPLYLYPLAHMAGISVDELLVHPYPLDLIVVQEPNFY